MHFYPDTPLPPTESVRVRGCARNHRDHPRLWGVQGFGEKGESWMGSVGFNGLLWNIVRLNQPNANLMPISQKHRASVVNSTISLKIPQISQKNTTFFTERIPSTTTFPPKPRIYATCNTHSRISRKAPQHNGFPPYMCYAILNLWFIFMPLHKSLDTTVTALGSTMN